MDIRGPLKRFHPCGVRPPCSVCRAKSPRDVALWKFVCLSTFWLAWHGIRRVSSKAKDMTIRCEAESAGLCNSYHFKFDKKHAGWQTGMHHEERRPRTTNHHPQPTPAQDKMIPREFPGISHSQLGQLTTWRFHMAGWFHKL